MEFFRDEVVPFWSLFRRQDEFRINGFVPILLLIRSDSFRIFSFAGDRIIGIGVFESADQRFLCSSDYGEGQWRFALLLKEIVSCWCTLLWGQHDLMAVLLLYSVHAHLFDFQFTVYRQRPDYVERRKLSGRGNFMCAMR